MEKRLRNILMCAGGLLLGVAVYLLFRENTYLSLLFQGSTFLACIRAVIDSKAVMQISFYLPDLLWSFSLCCGIQAIYLPKSSGIYAAAAVAFVCGVAWELLQWTDLVSGTGDYWDILMYFLGSTFAIIMNIRREKNEEA